MNHTTSGFLDENMLEVEEGQFCRLIIGLFLSCYILLHMMLVSLVIGPHLCFGMLEVAVLSTCELCCSA